MLVRAVGIQKFAADIDYLFAVPVHDEPRLGLDLRHGHGLKIFFICQCEESVNIVRLDNDRHALLALAYSKLRAVETLVFFRHCIEVYLESVRELAYGNRYAARAEVVAALDHQAGIFISEEPLELSLLGGIALLNLGTAAFERFDGVGLRGAGSSAAAVASGRAAEQDDNVSGRGYLAAHILRGRCRYYCADFHSLGGVAGMIYLVDYAGGKAYLVAV